MNPQEERRPPESCDAACRAAEVMIQDVEQLLLESRPDVLDRCETKLREVTGILEGLISAGKRDWTPEAGAAFRRIKRAAGRLHQQVEHASNLWAGWLQLRLGTGYTDRGRPVFSRGEPGSAFEA
jgi:hypothetical protein